MRAKPSIYIPTLYFAEGLPYTIVALMSTVFYKNIGVSNAFIGMTSFLTLPWTLKFLWSPFVDIYGTKRKWVLVAQAVLGCIALLLIGAVFLPDAEYVSLVIFFIMALASATHDVAIDGYYLDVLNKEQQAFYVGVRNAAYKVAWLSGSGGLVFLAGSLAESTSLGVKGGWAVSFAVGAALLLICAAFHTLALPEPKTAATTKEGAVHLSPKEFFSVLSTWLNQPRIAIVVFYILIFRLGDALMLKMAQPFLLDPIAKGGLAISTADVGIIYGTVGMLFLLAGGIIGGALVSKYGLRKCLLPTALIQNSAITLYWWLALAKPAGSVNLLGFPLTEMLSKMTDNPDVLRWFDARLLLTISVNSVEQFAYGLGTAAYTVFLLSTVRSEYKAAHYAIATAIMAFGVMIPGFISGWLQESLGYERFFLISFIASLPGMAAIFALPLDNSSASEAEEIVSKEMIVGGLKPAPVAEKAESFDQTKDSEV
ncbi:MFS transporter [Candidatus Obscuribacterales bacterium]|nr:MFS transporter [Candidatus Obscuribacterales bacterium]